MTKIIAIGGVSRSGKSTLAERIKDHFAGEKVLILSQDNFVKEENDIPKVRDRTDWEHPDSIDVEWLLRAIEESRNLFDLIVVEGLMAFWFPVLDTLYDSRIIMVITKNTFLKRRKEETRWGNEPTWFREHVWDSYLKYGQPSVATIKLSGEDQLDLETIIDKLEINSR